MASASTTVSYQNHLINSNQLGYQRGSHNIRLNEAKAYKSKVNLSNVLFVMQQENQGHLLC